MGVVYHGSSTHGLKELVANNSTHGKYIYATKNKLLATHFAKRCGDDLVYDIDTRIMYQIIHALYRTGISEYYINNNNKPEIGIYDYNYKGE